jgi:tetratricopeptide (TPR) repeat protein
MSFIFSRFYLLLCLTFLIFSPELVSSDKVDPAIRRGLEHCYNFRWNSAEQEFKKIISNNPDDPRGYHYLSSVYLWYYLSSSNAADFKTFLKHSDMAVDLAERAINRRQDDEPSAFILGNAYSYRMLGYAKAESYINAIWASKKSEKYLKKVIELNPLNYDAYLGLGLYNFAAAQIPSAFKWALSLAGISGNEDTGIEFIRLAAEKGSLVKIEAQYYLGQLLSGVLYDYKAAAELSESLHRKYPSNILFSYVLAVVHLKQKDPASAGKLLKVIVADKNTRFIQVVSFSNFLLGDVYFRKNEFTTAIGYYQEFLKTTTNNDYTGIAALRLGLSYDMLGDAASAQKYYAGTSEGNSDIEDDLFARRKGSKLKKSGLSQDEKTLQRNINLIEAGKFKNAYKDLQNLADSAESRVIRAEAYFYLSEAAYYSGENDQAIIYALKGTEIDSGEEGWIKAYGYYNAARSSKFIGMQDQMLKYIELSERNNRWDYQNQLENLLKSIRKNNQK